MNYPVQKHDVLIQIIITGALVLIMVLAHIAINNGPITNPEWFFTSIVLIIGLFLFVPVMSSLRVWNGTGDKRDCMISSGLPFFIGLSPLIYPTAQKRLQELKELDAIAICEEGLELMDTDFPAGLQMFKDAFCGREDLFGSEQFEQFEMIRKILDKAEEYEARLTAEYCANYYVTVLIKEIVYQGPVIGSRDFENRMMDIAPMGLGEVFSVRSDNLDIANMIKDETEKRTLFLRQLRKHFGHMSNTALIADLNFHYNKKHDKVLEQGTVIT
ncbi:hypothetical protein ACFL0K_02825 [Patescibacteria group bacterium]